jgi:hypothetical protein
MRENMRYCDIGEMCKLIYRIIHYIGEKIRVTFVLSLHRLTLVCWWPLNDFSSSCFCHLVCKCFQNLPFMFEFWLGFTPETHFMWNLVLVLSHWELSFSKILMCTIYANNICYLPVHTSEQNRGYEVILLANHFQEPNRSLYKEIWI